MFKSWANARNAGVLACLLLAAILGVGQTIAPPIAEYRGKAQGMFELRNDGDAPLAAILEIHGFKVNETGTLVYTDLDPETQVEIGANSFIIPPHQSHMVFYKANSKKPCAWFAILSTLTKAAQDRQQFRINFVLPHVVYLYQKQRLKKDDIEATIAPAEKPGEFSVKITNRSEKLGRVESVSSRGFEKNAENGGFPLFPGATRFVTLATGSASADAGVRVTFEDGFSLQIPVR